MKVNGICWKHISWNAISGLQKQTKNLNQTKTNKDHVGLTYISYVVIHDFTGMPQTADWFVDFEYCNIMHWVHM